MDRKFYEMLNELSYIWLASSIIGVIVFFIVVYMVIQRLNSLINEQKKTNILLRKQIDHQGVHFTPDEEVVLYKIK